MGSGVVKVGPYSTSTRVQWKENGSKESITVGVSYKKSIVYVWNQNKMRYRSKDEGKSQIGTSLVWEGKRWWEE